MLRVFLFGNVPWKRWGDFWKVAKNIIWTSDGLSGRLLQLNDWRRAGCLKWFRVFHVQDHLCRFSSRQQQFVLQFGKRVFHAQESLGFGRLVLMTLLLYILCCISPSPESQWPDVKDFNVPCGWFGHRHSWMTLKCCARRTENAGRRQGITPVTFEITLISNENV